MKKIYILSGLMCLLPGLSFGENPRIAELTRSKQEKMERLQKCEGTTKALKIAGLSTIGLTAVGVVGNVVESQKLQQYQSQSKSLDSGITKTKQEIADKKAEIAKKKQEEANLIEEIRKDIGSIKMFDANNLIGKEIRLSYAKTDVPNEIKSELDAAIDEFKNKCKNKYGADKVNTESSDSNVFAICECKYGKKDNEDACNETTTATPEPVATSFVDCTETGATENAKCTGVDHAKNAYCKTVGSSLKCFATLCDNNYLVRVKNGYCKTESEAQAECGQLVFTRVTSDGVENAGYKCMPSGNNTHAASDNSLSVTLDDETTVAIKKETLKTAVAHNANGSCDIYKLGKWSYNQNKNNCIMNRVNLTEFRATFDTYGVYGTGICEQEDCYCKITKIWRVGEDKRAKAFSGEDIFVVGFEDVDVTCNVNCSWVCVDELGKDLKYFFGM